MSAKNRDVHMRSKNKKKSGDDFVLEAKPKPKVVNRQAVQQAEPVALGGAGPSGIIQSFRADKTSPTLEALTTIESGEVLTRSKSKKKSAGKEVQTKRGNKNESAGYSEGDIVLKAKPNSELIYQRELKIYIKQLQKEHSYWEVKKDKLNCTLCDRNVSFVSISLFTNEIRSHMKTVQHKENYELFLLDNKDVQKSHTSTEDCKLFEELKKVENILLELKLSNNNNTFLEDNKQSVNLRSVLNPLYKNDSTLVGSEEYIEKAKDGKNYYCKICHELIFESQNIIEFRYNFFLHFNDMSHKKRMSNFSEVEKNFKEVMLELSKTLPPNLRKYKSCFQICPVSRYVKCSICEDVESENVRFLEKHLTGNHHDYNKGRNLNSLPQRSKNKHLSNWFTSLMTRLENEFKHDVHEGDLSYIHCGIMPGYVVCSVCARTVPDRFQNLKSHFEHPMHEKNKKLYLRKMKKKRNTEKPDNILKKPHENQVDPSSLYETKYGFKCCLCNLTIPPTSYAIYRHVIKSRCPSK
ncbi:uncharacterized protein LOC128985421 [Macrosteles quadrilineatus]|uniref:uncharacterized protein LOC128985421 n=1 Tax=Macrosteles quadrilineatus TaxID=74068 RepID=UPI0023E2B227|nr:uncharacterized protein LOC128985421 [Macrosteles quadrilineatus]